APSEQHEAGEGEQVAVHHPGEAGRGEPEVGADRRQRDVHDRRVEDHHELAGAHQRQDQPGGSGVRSGPAARRAGHDAAASAATRSPSSRKAISASRRPWYLAASSAATFEPSPDGPVTAAVPYGLPPAAYTVRSVNPGGTISAPQW